MAIQLMLKERFWDESLLEEFLILEHVRVNLHGFLGSFDRTILILRDLYFRDEVYLYCIVR